MKNSIVKLVISASIVILIQVFGYIYFSKRYLFERLSSEIDGPYFQLNDKIKAVTILYSNSIEDSTILLKRSGISGLNSTSSDKDILKSILVKKFEKVDFVESDSTLNNIDKMPFVAIYVLFHEKTFLYTSKTDEYLYVVDDDGESYEISYSRKYIWILFGWIKIEDIARGQS